jgi:uncharacterized protein (TIGR00730 family)
MKSVTVFCGSSLGSDKSFENDAILLGNALAKRNIELIYGGAKVGIMGAVANGVLSAGGNVVGVIPNFLKTKEVVHDHLTELISVESMHQRKTIMFERCEGIIALPGGFGTMEELFEMLTWAQLGLHKKPIAIYNQNGFYSPLLAMIQTMVDMGFLKEINQQMLLVGNTLDELFDKMSNYKAPVVGKWITSENI